MPKFLVGNGVESRSVVLIKTNQRLTVTAEEVWRTFNPRAVTMKCIKCYERGGQCTRNYPAGCKGHL